MTCTTFCGGPCWSRGFSSRGRSGGSVCGAGSRRIGAASASWVRIATSCTGSMRMGSVLVQKKGRWGGCPTSSSQGITSAERVPAAAWHWLAPARKCRFGSGWRTWSCSPLPERCQLREFHLRQPTGSVIGFECRAAAPRWECSTASLPWSRFPNRFS